MVTAELLQAISAASARWVTEPAAALGDLKKMLVRAGDDVDAALPVLNELIALKERHERIKHRQMPYHAKRLDELFFHYAKAELRQYLGLTEKALSAPTASVSSVLHRCMALFAVQDLKPIDQLLSHITQLLGRHVWTNVSFRPDFYEELARMSDEDVAAGLPEVEYGSVPSQDGPVAYLACDHQYYLDFGLPMLRSIAYHRPAAAVHLHLMDTSTSQREVAQATCDTLGLAISISSEQLKSADRADVMTARGYFHAVRFIRLYQHLRRFSREVWLLDVDALFNQDPGALYALRGDADVAFRARPGRFEPWNQFNASVVGISPTSNAIAYIRQIAAYIGYFYRKNMLGWGIDQLAMYSVFEHMKQSAVPPTVSLLDARAVDYDYRDDGIVWCNSGGAKISRAPPAEASTPRAKFEAAFRRYGTTPS